MCVCEGYVYIYTHNYSNNENDNSNVEILNSDNIFVLNHFSSQMYTVPLYVNMCLYCVQINVHSISIG